jgi:hypothetical protein
VIQVLLANGFGLNQDLGKKTMLLLRLILIEKVVLKIIIYLMKMVVLKKLIINYHQQIPVLNQLQI